MTLYLSCAAIKINRPTHLFRLLVPFFRPSRGASKSSQTKKRKTKTTTAKTTCDVISAAGAARRRAESFKWWPETPRLTRNHLHHFVATAAGTDRRCDRSEQSVRSV